MIIGGRLHNLGGLEQLLGASFDSVGHKQPVAALFPGMMVDSGAEKQMKRPGSSKD